MCDTWTPQVINPHLFACLFACGPAACGLALAVKCHALRIDVKCGSMHAFADREILISSQVPPCTQGMGRLAAVESICIAFNWLLKTHWLDSEHVDSSPFARAGQWHLAMYDIR
jgi:hypothetical protein